MVPAHSPSKNNKAVLLLEAGTFSICYCFGASPEVSSEITLSTSMDSFVEAIANSPCMKPCCGFSAVTADKGSAISAMVNELREDRKCQK